MIDTPIIRDEVVSWFKANAPIGGFILVIALLAWTVRGATSTFDHHIDEVEEKVVEIDKRLIVVETKLDALTTKVDERFAETNKRLDKLDEKFDKLDEKFDQLLEELRNNRK